MKVWFNHNLFVYFVYRTTYKEKSDIQYTNGTQKKVFRLIRICILLIDFSLTVKATTLIFISGRGSAILSAEQGIIWRRINKLIGPRKRACIS